MRPVKSRTRPDTPTEQRLRQVAVSLGLGKELPVAWVADKAGIPRSTLKNAAARDSLSYELARAIARLMVGEEAPLVAWLMGESAEVPERAALAPRMPAATRSGSDGPKEEGGVSYAKQTSGPAVAAWLALGAEMQHNLAVKVIKEALEAQDFAGSPVLRALHGIAQKMDEMGYTAMSRHIWAEMGKYFGQQLPPEGKP